MKKTLRAQLSPTRTATPHGVAGDNSTWGTPRELYDWVDGFFGFTIDVCASAENYKHPRYYDEATNGLQQSWTGERFWVNPPYGKGVDRWITKSRAAIVDEGATAGALLLPYRADTAWWCDHVLQGDGWGGKFKGSRFMPATRVHWYWWQHLTVGVHVLEERVQFVGAKDPAPFITAVVMFLGESFEPLPGDPGRRFALTDGFRR